MRYLILILSAFFVFACAMVKEEVVIEVVKQLDSVEAILPHITIEELSKDNWKQVDSDPYPQRGIVDFYLANEDSSMEIQYVVVRYSPSQKTPLGYAYLFKNEIYIFTRDRAGGFRLANLPDASMKWWIGQFRKYFLGESDL